jgi:hypothetical protein
MADNLRKYKSLYSSTSNSFGTGTGETITPNSVSGLPTSTEITLTFDRVDSSGTETPTKMERIIGTISGGNFVISTRGADGSTEQAHTSPVVEMIWNAKDWNDLIDCVLVQHNQTGTHKSITTTGNISASNVSASSINLTSGATVTSIKDEDNMASDSATALATQQSIKAYVNSGTVTMTNKTLTSPVINTPTGDVVTSVDGSASNYFKTGNMMIAWGVVASESITAGSVANTSVSFPVAFKAASTPIVTTSVSGLSNTNKLITLALSITNSGFSFRKFNYDSSITETNFIGDWMAVGLIA